MCRYCCCSVSMTRVICGLSVFGESFTKCTLSHPYVLFVTFLTFYHLLSLYHVPDHSIKDMKLIPLELQPTNNASRRKAREAYFIEKGQTLTPHGINRRNEH